MDLKKGINVVLDAQWGSTGKGKLTGFLGRHSAVKPDFCCSSFGPNAGHTFVDGDDVVVLKALSMGSYTSRAPALVMPDSVIEPESFMSEVKLFSSKGIQVLVHPRVAVVTGDDANAAAITGRHIAGTMKGTGHALSRKMLRMKGVKLAKDILPPHMIADTCDMVRKCVANGGTVLFEMSQGFDLSLNHGHDYPYLTSRDITIGAAINSCGCSHKDVSQVIGSVRTLPIRVGNVEGGNSGPHYPDQTELTWVDVKDDCGSPDDLTEITTVTKRVRRVFSFSAMQLMRFIEMNRPDYVFLNFAQYIDYEAKDVVEFGFLPESVREWVYSFENHLKVPVKLIGTGADDCRMIVR